MKKPSILVVDDSPSNLSFMNQILNIDYNVQIADCGKDALTAAESKDPPDLVLLDILMPEMDGYEVCRHLKANPKTKNIPVIFLTALDHDEDEVIGFEAGAADYITKPIVPVVAKARINTQLALNSKTKELRKTVLEKTVEINNIQLEIIKKLSKASELRDNETGFHIERISEYSYQIAKHYGLDEEECILIKHASPMHDIGKIGVPEGIILKQGPLDDGEWEIMRKHSEIGGEILGDSDSKLLAVAKIMALQHHEKWDGTGYPLGLKGSQISIYARIVAIADVFDALISKRPYKKAWSIPDAVKCIIASSEKHFDPDVVKAFSMSLDTLIKIKKKYK